MQGLSSPHARARPARGAQPESQTQQEVPDAYRTPTTASDHTGEAASRAGAASGDPGTIQGQQCTHHP
ncbi:hypothetical protein [uncultured Actinomyces sp.]|uniref:hypothetical protein n=1 Tax=uncultured Actinomyces sp. TaxID=249061 RepID=UPI0028E80C40|nr:hypothetical protein [uncultured Actinomyces sp.]